ncbi:MAG: ribonuclease H-like domain-containing protein, partial [Syntrophales bacterium LBB04]|nr:ribonuclease H-like domain-containing protein [Syntrophales bacterium LBB04]
MGLRDRLERALGDGSPPAAVPAQEDTGLALRLQRLAGETKRGERAPKKHLSLADDLGGEMVDTEHGSFITVKSTCGVDFIHGDSPLSTIHDIQEHILPLLARNASLSGHNASQVLFLDTETTGLSGGDGKNVVLIGAGFFENGR